MKKLVSSKAHKHMASQRTFAPMHIACSAITLGLCLTGASIGTSYAYAAPVHKPFMQSNTQTRTLSDTHDLQHTINAHNTSGEAFDRAAQQQTSDMSKTRAATLPGASQQLNNVSAVLDASDVQTSAQPLAKHLKASDRAAQDLSKSDLLKNNVADSSQEQQSRKAPTSAVRSAANSYDVPFELHYKSFPSEMTYFQKWESGHNYDHGFGAGDSYNALGAYQFDRRYGLATFMKQVYNYDPQTFKMLATVGEKYNWDFSTPDVFDKNTSTFTQFGNDLNQAWHSAYAASPDTFSRLQDYYAYHNYYAGSDGVKKSLSFFGINADERSNSFKSLVWGMANLFGKGGGISSLRKGNYWGCNKFFKLANIDGSMNDAQLIVAICDAVIDNVKNIYPHQQIYWQGYINRYTDEKAHYLGLTIGAWQQDSNGRRYIDATGRPAKGWFKSISNKWWYADPSTGYSQTGVCSVDGYNYYIDPSDGLVYQRWIASDDQRWMRTDKSGILITGWYHSDGGAWYYFGSDGKSVSGELVDNGKHYGLDANQGLVYNAWGQDTRGRWFHTDDSGCLVKGWYKTPNGKWWYFGNDFKMVIGQLNDNGRHYWLDSSAGLLYNGWGNTDDGSWFHTDDSGCLVKGWYQTSNGKWWYFGNDFKMVTGLLNDNGHHYWLDPNKGLSCNTWIQDAAGNWFYTDNTGKFAAGWCHTSNNKWFYFDPQSNKAIFGNINVNNEHFYIDEAQGLDLSKSDSPSIETLKNWLLRAASGEIGYEAFNDPQPGSKYGRWMADITDTPWLRGPSSEVWWCAIFVSWCFDQAHVSWDALPSYNCDQIYSRALYDGRSQILSDVHDCKPGDIVLYNFHGGRSCQHIGIIESNNGSTITTIEGNTSSGDGGSQHAGNGVWRRTRPFTYVRAIVRPYPFV